MEGCIESILGSSQSANDVITRLKTVCPALQTCSLPGPNSDSYCLVATQTSHHIT